MKTRSFEHKRKLKIWITSIFAFISWIGIAWWIDAQEFAFLEGWGEWLKDLHFLVSLVIIMAYFTVIYIIVHFYWKAVQWIVGKLVDRFY